MLEVEKRWWKEKRMSKVVDGDKCGRSKVVEGIAMLKP